MRTRKELFEAKVALAAAEGRERLLLEEIARMREHEDALRRRVSDLEQGLTVARDALKGADDQVRDLEIKNAVLTERLDLVANYFPAGASQPSDEKKHMSEEEEDLQHALAAGLINRQELGEALEAAGLQNTEITLDFEPRDYPRLGGQV